MAMSKPRFPEELWAIVDPPAARTIQALRRASPRRRPGRSDRIIFVLKTGIPWESLPQALGCSSGVTCWRRLRDWQEAGV